MKSYFSTICVIVITSLVFCSCKSREEKVLEQLNNLTEKVEKNSSDWNSDQWTDAFEELEKIHSEMSDCDFTNQQLQELGEVEGRLTSLMLSNGVESLGKGIGSFLKGAGSFVKGFQEGIQDGSEESIEELENYVNSTLDDLLDNDRDN